MKEALLFNRLKENKVKCRLCPRLCVIKEGKRGYCGVRVNKEGTLYTLVYGLASSIAADPIEKKPLFHFYPGTLALSLGTLGCNLQCKHCQNWQIAHAEPDLSGHGLTGISPEETIRLAQRHGCLGVAWTYNEPTIWFEHTLDSAKLCKKEGLYTVYVTNGYITAEALDMIGPYLDSFRVDVKGFTKDFYRWLAKVPDFTPILKAAERAKRKWKMHVEVVTNIIPTRNDDEKQLRGIAQWIVSSLGPETPWHVTRFIPYLDLSHLSPTPVATLEKARGIGLEEGLRFVYLGNVSGHSAENTYCPHCGQMVIERTGYSLSRYEVEKGKCKFCSADLNIVG